MAIRFLRIKFRCDLVAQNVGELQHLLMADSTKKTILGVLADPAQEAVGGVGPLLLPVVRRFSGLLDQFINKVGRSHIDEREKLRVFQIASHIQHLLCTKMYLDLAHF